MYIISNLKTNHLDQERASPFTSKGSITLEAAVVIPVFFFAILCMMYLFEVMAIQSSISSACQCVGKAWAEESYLSPMVFPSELEKEIVRVIGKEKLDNSILANGSEGISCEYSKVNLKTAVLNLNVRYQLEIPVLMFRLPIRTYEERLRVKGWTGDIGLGSELSEDDYVYVTDYGMVYHRSLACGYLELTIRGISVNKLYNERNEYGAIYYRCETCGDLPKESVVYVTDYGNRYHTTLACSGLKRSIHIVELSEVNGLGGCSKCVY